MNKEIIELREVVTKLVPLLTGKGLIVTQRGAQAFVRVNNVTGKPELINIPNISDNATPDFIRAIQGFIDHEVAHVLITNWEDYLVKGSHGDRKLKRLQDMVNIVEDTMIEREIVKIFPGSRKNIADMRLHFIDKITMPAVAQAKDDKEIFHYVIVPMMRALAGHEEFQAYMDSSGMWKNPFVAELLKKMSAATKALLPKMTSTKQTRKAAEEIDAILYPAHPAPVLHAIEPDTGSTAGGDEVLITGDHLVDILHVRIGGKKVDWKLLDLKVAARSGNMGAAISGGAAIVAKTPNHAAGVVDVIVQTDWGTGTLPQSFTFVAPPPSPPSPEKDESNEDQDESESDDSGEAGDGAEGEGESQDKPEKKAGKGDGDGKRDHSESEEGDEEGEASDEAEEGGVQGNEADDDSANDEDGTNDSDDENNGAADQGQDGEADEENEDGNGADDNGEDEGDKDGNGGSSDDADDEKDKGGEHDESKQKPANEGKRGDTVDIDDRDHHSGGVGDEEKSEGGGGGVGGDGSGRSMFDTLEDDAFENADISSRVAILITEEAIASINESDYTVYTRELDKIEVLEVPDKIDARWVPELEDETRQMTGRMQKDIERMLASQSHIIRTSGHRSGRLHAPSLHRLTSGDERIFHRKQEHKSKDTAVMLLVDNSGSMSGEKLRTAMVAAYALSTTLERVSIAHEVIGFTTSNWYGMPASITQAMNDEIMKLGVRFSRTLPIHMPIYKTFDERVTSQVKKRIAYMARAQSGLQGNIDGESLEYGAIRLLPRREKRKVMIVLSDGHPVNADNAAGHLHMTVRKLEKMGIDMVGIGIMDSSVRDFYPKHVVLNQVADLPGQVMQELKAILS